MIFCQSISYVTIIVVISVELFCSFMWFHVTLRCSFEWNHSIHVTSLYACYILRRTYRSKLASFRWQRTADQKQTTTQTVLWRSSDTRRRIGYSAHILSARFVANLGFYHSLWSMVVCCGPLKHWLKKCDEQKRKWWMSITWTLCLWLLFVFAVWTKSWCISQIEYKWWYPKFSKKYCGMYCGKYIIPYWNILSSLLVRLMMYSIERA